MQAAYHLGNRHVALQIDANRLRYLHDHVLDAMLAQLGLTVLQEQAPFEPESGAYSGGHHHHHQD
jgi:urease accessory protein